MLHAAESAGVQVPFVGFWVLTLFDEGLLDRLQVGLSFAPTDEIDAFSFFLQQPSSGSFSVTAAWDGGSTQAQDWHTVRSIC